MEKVSTCCIIFLLIVKEIQSRYQKELNNLPIPGELMARMKKYYYYIIYTIIYNHCYKNNVDISGALFAIFNVMREPEMSTIFG